MRDHHKDRKVTWIYVCSECGEEFQDKKKVSAHVNRVHVGKAIKKDMKSGAFLCHYCEETFQSFRGRSQHVRNQHAAAQSAHLAGESSLKTSVDSQPRHLDEETVEKFIRALFVVGTGSNVEIAREMKSKKTAHNVKGYKLRFLKDHPNSNIEFRHLDPKGILSDSENITEEKETTENREEVTTEVGTVETPVEREETVEIEAAVETEGVPEKEVVTTPVNSEPEVTVETVKAEAVPGEEVTMEMETPVDVEQAEEMEVTMETGGNEEAAVEIAPTVPHVHGAGVRLFL